MNFRAVLHPEIYNSASPLREKITASAPRIASSRRGEAIPPGPARPPQRAHPCYVDFDETRSLPVPERATPRSPPPAPRIARKISSRRSVSACRSAEWRRFGKRAAPPPPRCAPRSAPTLATWTLTKLVPSSPFLSRVLCDFGVPDAQHLGTPHLRTPPSGGRPRRWTLGPAH